MRISRRGRGLAAAAAAGAAGGGTVVADIETRQLLQLRSWKQGDEGKKACVVVAKRAKARKRVKSIGVANRAVAGVQAGMAKGK